MSAMPAPFPIAAVPALSLQLRVTDPEVVAELTRRAEGPERDEYALHALRIGVLASRHAAGAIDVEAIRRAGDDVVSTVREVFLQHAAKVNADIGEVVRHYFDPASGSLPQRIEQLVKGDGDLERLLAKHLDGDRSTIYQTLDRVFGPKSDLIRLLSPEQAGSVVASMKSAVDELLKKQRDEVLRQFSLDDKTSALARLVVEIGAHNGKLRADLAQDMAKVSQEFSLDNESGALSRLVGRVEGASKTIAQQLSLDHEGSALQRMSVMLENTGKAIEKSLTLDVEASPLARLRRELVQISDRIEKSQASFQAEMREAVAALQARKEEAKRSTAHGNDFEGAMEEVLHREAQRAGDVYRRVGARPGPGGTKKGDHLIELGPESAAPGARIVIESKAQKGYTIATALDELEAARENREAQIGIFVFSEATAPKGVEGVLRVGDAILAEWNPEDPGSDLYLRLALSVARALVVRECSAGEQSEEDLEAIDRAVREIEKQAKQVDAIAKAAKAVQTKGEWILENAEAMKEALEEQLEALRASVESLRGGGEE
jgi:hypothetical protein